ncbi:MAG: peptidoglycan DD-metalloendopeptidase family protein [Pseudomonadota bacterium]
MKIILLREAGNNVAIKLSRRAMLAVSVSALLVSGVAGGFLVKTLTADSVDAEVVDSWRARLQEQDQLVESIAARSDAQSAAVGKKLAQMQARLLRMEAIGEHMADAADLTAGEFDFSKPPAQGGPAVGQQTPMAWSNIEQELSGFASQLKQREQELKILGEVLASEGISQTSEVSGRPVRWGWLSSNYGERVDPITGQNAWHSGVDFAGKDGSDVIAVASGVVTFSGKRYGYGNLVEISHANGLVTRYAHHKEVLVNTGDVVKKGDAIGIMGSTGRSTGPHVHFEVLRNGRHVDPAKYVR